jgi:hypothetical protein
VPEVQEATKELKSMGWLVLPIENPDGEIDQIDVVPGEMVDDVPVYHGHALGPGCDCKPTVLTRVHMLIVIHRHNV